MKKKHLPILHFYILSLSLFSLSCCPALGMEDDPNDQEASPRTEEKLSPRPLSTLFHKPWMNHLTKGSFFPDNFTEVPEMTYTILSNTLKNITKEKELYQSIMYKGNWLYIYQSYDLYNPIQIGESCTYYFLDKVVNDKPCRTTLWSYLALDSKTNNKYYFMMSLHHWPSLVLSEEKIKFLKDRMTQYMWDASDKCDAFRLDDHPYFPLANQRSSLPSIFGRLPSKEQVIFNKNSTSNPTETVSIVIEKILSALPNGVSPSRRLILKQSSITGIPQEITLQSSKSTKLSPVNHLNLVDLNFPQRPRFGEFPPHMSFGTILSMPNQSSIPDNDTDTMYSSLNLSPPNPIVLPRKSSKSETPRSGSDSYHSSASQSNSPHSLNSSPHSPQLSPTSNIKQSLNRKSESPRTPNASPRTPLQSPTSLLHRLSKSRAGSPRVSDSIECPKQSSQRVIKTDPSGLNPFIENSPPFSFQDNQSESRSSEEEMMTVKIRIPRRLEDKLLAGNILNIELSFNMAQQERSKDKLLVKFEDKTKEATINSKFDDTFEELLALHQSEIGTSKKTTHASQKEQMATGDPSKERRKSRVSSSRSPRKSSGGTIKRSPSPKLTGKGSSAVSPVDSSIPIV